MDIKTQLKDLIKAADLYRSQGLLAEAIEKYQKAADIIQRTDGIPSRQNLIDHISNKIVTLQNKIKKIEKQSALPEVPKEEQDLIKELFTESEGKSKDEANMEGAMTLAKFGQFDRAIEEFTQMLEKASLRIEAAKNILRCHMAYASIDDAVTQFQKWQTSPLFSSHQLLTIRLFLEVFRYDNQKEKISHQLRDASDVEELDITNGKCPDICSMIITLEEGPLRGGTFILDVSFQTGNVITLFLESHKEELLENFETGKMLSNVQYHSTIAIFKGKGMVIERVKMESGSRQGDYRIDIHIFST
ncbi:MAG: hypothetical protein JSV38_00200 [Desulfobacterales bacterium]|nr:MAG: hypothetical protein JSV38_00200 [Desulfobacterales bacterium]